MTSDQIRASAPGREEPPADDARATWATIPNAICLFRILASPCLVLLAMFGRRSDVVALFVAMALSDWIDGKIARWFHQRSKIGPWLDSVSDIAMYSSLLLAVVLLDGPRLGAQWPWVSAPIVLYLAAGAWSWARFGRWPNHHTRMANISWGLMLMGAVAFLGEWSVWPLRVALIGAALASVQSMLITRTLPEYRSDVSSISAARRIARSAL